MNDTAALVDEALASYADREMSWLPHDRRGRWVVIEPGPGRLLRGEPRSMRDLVDAVSERRARRFSSLSRARTFARQVDGDVFRWRRTPPGGGVWQRHSPWQRALKMTSWVRWLPAMIEAPPRENKP